MERSSIKTPTPCDWPNASALTGITCSPCHDKPDVPFDDNLAERCIRPAVILRKNSYANRSQQGAATQAVLMTVYRTLKLRGLNPTRSIAQALSAYLATGRLPPVPDTPIADG
jgi:transposase